MVTMGAILRRVVSSGFGAFIVCLVMLLSLTEAEGAPPGVPRTMNYQGFLTDEGGNPLTTGPLGPLRMIFTLHEQEIADTPLWSETQYVSVNEGVYSIVLGAAPGNPLTPAFDMQYFLEVQVETAPGSGQYETLSPRRPLNSTPYAIRAIEADLADDIPLNIVTTSKIADDAVTDAKILGPVSSSKIQRAGLDADTVDTKHAADLQNRVTGTCTGGESISIVNADGSVSCTPAGVPVPLHLTGPSPVIQGTEASTGTYGQLGHARYGVYGRGDGTIYYGVYGKNNNNTGFLASDDYGAYGAYDDGVGTSSFGYLGGLQHGVYAESAGPAGDSAVKGKRSRNFGLLGHDLYGAYGENESGANGRLGGDNYGVEGVAASLPAGAGVRGQYGFNFGYLGTIDYGVKGVASQFGLTGVRGERDVGGETPNFGELGTAEYGVYGSTYSGPAGIYGRHGASGNYAFVATSDKALWGYNPTKKTEAYMGSGVAVYGSNASTNTYGWIGGAFGVYGEDSATGNYGEMGHSGWGVRGASALQEGVRGESVTGAGVLGKSIEGNGVEGYNNGPGGRGGYFHADDGDGARFEANTFGYVALAAEALGTSEIAIYAKSSVPEGFAGYFEGRVSTDVLVVRGGADLAEPFDVVDEESIEPGMVVSIDSEHPGQLKVSEKAYDRKVAGIVSGANGIVSGLTMSQEGTPADGSLPVALTGRVYAWADASGGPIEAGDMLTTSNTPGHAMKVTDFERAHGTVLGKAMSSLDEGKGLVLVLVTLQ